MSEPPKSCDVLSPPVQTKLDASSEQCRGGKDMPSVVSRTKSTAELESLLVIFVSKMSNFIIESENLEKEKAEIKSLKNRIDDCHSQNLLIVKAEMAQLKFTKESINNEQQALKMQQQELAKKEQALAEKQQALAKKEQALAEKEQFIKNRDSEVERFNGMY